MRKWLALVLFSGAIVACAAAWSVWDRTRPADAQGEDAAARASALAYIDALCVRREYAEAYGLMCDHDKAALGGMSHREFAQLAPRFLPTGGLPVTSGPTVGAQRLDADGQTAEVDMRVSVTATEEEGQAAARHSLKVVSVQRTENGELTAEVPIICRLHRHEGHWSPTIFSENQLQHMAADLIVKTWETYVQTRRQHKWLDMAALYDPAALRARYGEGDSAVGLQRDCEEQEKEQGRPFQGAVASWRRVERHGDSATLSTVLTFLGEGETEAPPGLWVTVHFAYDRERVRWLISGIESARGPG